jgi:hypothetical protein
MKVRPRFWIAMIAVGTFGLMQAVPTKSDAQIAREKIEALQRFKAVQDAMVNVYIQQLSAQTNDIDR